MREIEIKLRVGNADEVRERLARAGAQIHSPREFEDNRLYDDAALSLAARESILRLRSKGGRHLVTYKEPESGPRESTGDGSRDLSPVLSSRFKIRTEHETTVGDPDAFDRIVRGLGLAPVWRYQKYRQSFVLGDVDVELDETPIGTFVEFEGAPDAIEAAVAALGYGGEPFITLSYRELAQEVSGTSDPADLVFEPKVTE